MTTEHLCNFVYQIFFWELRYFWMLSSFSLSNLCMLSQGSKGIRHWPINLCTFPLMINKNNSSGVWSLKSLDTQPNKPTNQILSIVPKHFYNTSGISITKSQMSPPSVMLSVQGVDWRKLTPGLTLIWRIFEIYTQQIFQGNGIGRKNVKSLLLHAVIVINNKDDIKAKLWTHIGGQTNINTCRVPELNKQNFNL